MPYLITGGLAARAYGSTRPLADIDIYVPDDRLAEMEPDLSGHILKPLHNRRSAFWNVTYIVVEYLGQQIELISSRDIHFLDTKEIVWIKQKVNFSRFESIMILGRKAGIMDRRDLLDYKSSLSRLVDLEDIQSLKAGF